MSDFKEISKSNIQSFLVIKDVTDDNVLLSKPIKNVLPNKDGGNNE